MYTKSEMTNKHMWTAGWLMAPLYVEYVRWLKEKQDRLGLPVKIALRDGEPINFVAKQMAKLDSETFRALNEWETVWLCRFLVYRLGRTYEDRDMEYYGDENERVYSGCQMIMKEWYMPRHGLDKTFIFADTGICGGMSKRLNQLGYANSPSFMVSSSRKHEYIMVSFDIKLKSMLEKWKQESDDGDKRLQKHFEVGHLIYILDSLPKPSYTAFGFVRDKAAEGGYRTYCRTKGKQELIWRGDFYAGLSTGVSMYMKYADKDNRLAMLLNQMVNSYGYIRDVFAKNLSDESLNCIQEVREKGLFWTDEQLLKRRKLLLENQSKLYGYKWAGR